LEPCRVWGWKAKKTKKSSRSNKSKTTISSRDRLAEGKGRSSLNRPGELQGGKEKPDGRGI
jgi:hypothetical protein